MALASIRLGSNSSMEKGDNFFSNRPLGSAKEVLLSSERKASVHWEVIFFLA